MTTPPYGTVTLLFTDIEGSTKRWEHYPRQMQHALSRHDAILRTAIEQQGGYVFKTVGDAFCAAFATPLSALVAALDARRALVAEDWAGELGQVRARMALHSGMVEQRDGDYFGQPLNRVARLLSAGHGGQILLSLSSQELVRDTLPEGIALRDMGEHRLKDLIRPEHVFQVIAPDFPEDFPPLNTLDNRPNNLPLQFTSLIGREKEIAAVGEMLHRADVRLVTLTGPGGTGKTRLGLQVAAELLDDFPDGVYFVELAALTDYNLVLPTVAQTLGVTEAAGGPLIDSLKDYLRDKNLLLVLDNFEQVADAAPMVDTLLKDASYLKVLVTGRTRLHLYGEREFPVPPLDLPPVGALDAASLSASALTQYEAVRLFIERARDVKPDFQVTNDNAPAVAEICARLDGLPLVIELAAARVRLFPPQALLVRLSSRLKMAIGGARDLTARQQTLRGTIDWSYDLLHEGEKQFFRRMAVFQGGRTLDGLEQVCNADGMLQVDVLEGVETLVSNSLLQQREGSDGEPRFWMLETIHEYAREKLQESGEAGALQKEHALYFMRVAEEARPHLWGADSTRSLHRLEEEHDNLRTALAWAIEEHEMDTALRLTNALYRFWYVLGYVSEGRRWFALALAQGASAAAALRAAALSSAAVLAQVQGEASAACVQYAESVALYRALGNKSALAGTLVNAGFALDDEGDSAAALASFEEGLALSREMGGSERPRVAIALNALALHTQDHSDLDTARAYANEALELGREQGHVDIIAGCLDTLGSIVMDQDDYASAHPLLIESLLLAREQGNKRIIAYVLEGFAKMASGLDQPERAAELFGAAQTMHNAIGAHPSPRELRLLAPYQAAARARLSDEGFERAMQEGQAMSMEQAIEYALKET